MVCAQPLSALLAAIKDHARAWSGRWLVDDGTGWTICRDEWDAIAPRHGINAERFGGFVNPSSLMLDKIACHAILPFCEKYPLYEGVENRLNEALDHLAPKSALPHREGFHLTGGMDGPIAIAYLRGSSEAMASAVAGRFTAAGVSM